MLLLPRLLLLGFVVMFGVQLLYHHLSRAQMAANYQALDQPLSAAVYRGIAMGSEQLLGYLLAMRLPKTEFSGTGAWFFIMVNSFKLPFYLEVGNITLETLARPSLPG